ncbi:MAG: cell division protein FtsZ, partial [Nesterenkonia sp.]|nr:cell division protein FtsZ [Nesterenkonia sp.]
AHPEANIIFGAVIDDALGDEARVTVIAAGFDQVDATSQPAPQPQYSQQSAPQRVPGTVPTDRHGGAPQQASGAAAGQHHQSGQEYSQPQHSQQAAPQGQQPSAGRAADEQQTAPQQRVPHQQEQQDIPDIVESDYTGSRGDDLDVPDFLK